MPTEIFLSHSSADRAFASDVAEMLRRHGLPVWYSDTNITGAQQWHDEIGEALRRCDWFVLVLSPASVGSMWVKRETLYALQQPRYENKIVPLIHQPCDPDQLSWVLSSFQMIDYTHDFMEGSRELLRVWGYGYKTV
jgi:hypothetical protein